MRGFPHAGIKAEIERLKEPYRINIHLQINTGEPERIRKINISGADDEVKAVMKLSDGDIFDQSILKKDIERIKAYYKNKEYFKPVIGPYTFTDGTLHISVNPGKRLHISIAGNDDVSTKALLKEMPFFEAEDFSDDIVEEAVHRMLSLYHTKGHPFAQIAPVITSKDDLISLNFFILEGVTGYNRISPLAATVCRTRILKRLCPLKKEKYITRTLLILIERHLKISTMPSDTCQQILKSFRQIPPSPLAKGGVRRITK